MAAPSTSSVPALKAALKTQLAARPNLKSVQISYGAPAPVPEIEFIMLGDFQGSQEPANMGRRDRNEQYVLEVLVRTLNSDPADGVTPETRAFALMAEVENELRSNPTVNGTVLSAGIGGEIEGTELIGQEARGYDLKFGVAVFARI